MVFGKTYCAISHLPIEDGDKCYLVPLGFEMKFDFDSSNKADINCFIGLYRFIDSPEIVIYNGNYSDITFIEKDGFILEHELFMLIHFDFFNKIQEQYDGTSLEYIETLPYFKTIMPILYKAREIQDNEALKIDLQVKNGTIIPKDNMDVLKLKWKIKTPEWIIQVYKIARFMSKLGISPSPNITADQHETGLLYEKIRASCIANNNSTTTTT